jgi:capsular polysaccharide transport system permease protein
MTMKLVANRFRSRKVGSSLAQANAPGPGPGPGAAAPAPAAPPRGMPYLASSTPQPAAPDPGTPAGALGRIIPNQIAMPMGGAPLQPGGVMRAKAARKIPTGDIFAEPPDGFDGMDFATARKTPGAAPAAPQPAAPAPVAGGNPAAAIDALRQEGLTGRQLRMARRMAQKHNLPATSDYDAVRLLREAGIDPFQTNTALDLVSRADMPAGASQSRELALSGGVQLPQTIKPAGLPSVEDRAAESHINEVARIQREIQQRRRAKMRQLFLRMALLVGIPTLLAGFYFYVIATPFYSTKTAFVVQKSDPSGAASAGAGLLSGSPMANATDSINVQNYLQSPEALLRLDRDNGFKAHYSNPDIDSLQRLPENATNAQAFKTYRRNVRISFDPTEGIIKMEVIAADPQVAVDISRSLITYAEEQVDQMTARQREDQMAGAEKSYREAEAKYEAANRRVVELQEKYKVLSSDVEVSLITGQISTLDGQLTQDRLSLAQMESNANPNLARMEPLKRRIATLEEEITTLRSKLTENSAGGGFSIARVQSELLVAQADVETRRMLLAKSLEATEAARTAADRQSRYLLVSVNPVAADEPTYPRSFENTLVALMIFLGLYLILSMTAAVLREQVTS